MKISNVFRTIGYLICHPVKTYHLIFSCGVNYNSFIDHLISNQSTLDQIGIKYGTDKASVRVLKNLVVDRTNDYLRFYDMVFQGIKERPKQRILEFGCQTGNSLDLWVEYFSNPFIVGVDLDSKCKAFEKDNVQVIVGNSSVFETVEQAKTLSNVYDIIIDDASHAWGEQRWNIDHYWPLLANGGVYVIEDVDSGAYGAYANVGYTPAIIDGTPIIQYVMNLTYGLQTQAFGVRESAHPVMKKFSVETQRIFSDLAMVMNIPGAIILMKKDF